MALIGSRRAILLGGGAVPVLTPRSVPGLTLWMDAALSVFSDAGTTPAVNNDPVQQWIDQASGIVFAQGTLGNRPLWKATGGAGGKPGVQSDGTDDGLTVATGPSSTVGSYTCYAVLNLTTVANPAYVLDIQTGRLIFHACVSGNVGYYDGSFEVVAAAATGNQILTWVVGPGSTGRVYRNGVSLGPAAYTAANLGGSASLFATSSQVNVFTGVLSELLLYTGAHPLTAVRGVNKYLGAKYGLPVS